ncbi:YciI family protein [Microbacterium lacus]|uniref:YciI family protein n=1 Tax=Microbacterium lacus TaxID=415217 RepID=UPI000C2BFB30|nr:YciI family protein [Microbacterium lacus]|tara:strand:+ start:98 stop:454 length:357 start_codon:yes stop_codon:yes gene_type:complete
MQYAILAQESPADFAARTDPALAADYWASWAGYVAALRESGIMSAAAGLQPPETSTTIRLRGGSIDVQDGPFADVKEHLGGVFLIDAPDLDTALEWAARCPAAALGSVEVRPVIPPMG